MGITRVMQILYLFATKDTSTQAVQKLDVSSMTVTNYLKYCRQLVTTGVTEIQDNMIGGPGRTVQIDEAKFGKRQYNRGHCVDGCWVFGGVEKNGMEDGTNKYFCVVVPDRTAETLIPLIQRYVYVVYVFLFLSSAFTLF